MATITNPDIAGRTQNKGARGSSTNSKSLYEVAASTTNIVDPNDGGDSTADAFSGQGGTRYNDISVSTNGLTRDLLVQMYGEILSHDLLPEAFIMNPREYVDLFTWGRDDFDPETQKDVLETGRMGKIWNCDIHMSKICPPGTVWCRTSDYSLGVMPILIDLDVDTHCVTLQ